MVAAWLIVAGSWAAETAAQQSGPSVLDGCLADDACGQAAATAIADGLRDAGFAAEHVGLATHAALSGRAGLALELGAQSFALPPGGPGLQPAGVGVAPVVPRIGIGAVVGDVASGFRAGFAAHGAPPAPVGGDVAWGAGLQFSAAWSDPAARTWLGFDLDVGYGAASGGLLDEQTLAALDPDARAPACPGACTDVFSELHAGFGSVLRVDPDPLTPVFLGLGGVVARQSITSAADGSTWTWAGLQPRARAGVGYRPAPAGLFALAVHAGLKGPAVIPRSRFTWTAAATFGWTVGPAPTPPVVAPGAGVASVAPAPAPRPVVIPDVPRADHPDLECTKGLLPTGRPPPGGREAWCVRVTQGGEVLRHGAYVRWWDETSIAERGEYQDGQKWHTWTEFDAEGHVIGRGDYVAGARHGQWTMFHASGELESRGEYLRGNPHGVWIYWSPNGQGRTEGAWTNGRREGLWRDYGPGGERRGERLYRDGRMIHSSSPDQ